MRAVRRTVRRTVVATVVTAAAAVATTGGQAGADANTNPERANVRAGVDAGAERASGTSVRSGTVGRTYWLRARAQFAPPTAAIRSDAVTYRQELVPAASRIAVSQTVRSAGMGVGVAVDGLRPGHTFGVHVHTEPCGSKPDDSGPHYQDEKDPVQPPSTDPAYANPENEIWLDLKTDARGHGAAATRHDWSFREGEARSVVLHEHATHTGHGEAGQAGDRVACFSVPFGSGTGDGKAGGTAQDA